MVRALGMWWTPASWLFVLRVTLVASILAIIGGIIMGIYTATWLAGAIRTEGRIVELVERHSGGDTLYVPVFEYEDASGRTVTIVPSYASNPAVGRVGDSIPVVYKPEQPDSAVVGTSFAVWGWTVLPLILGGAYCVIASAILWARRRYTRLAASGGTQEAGSPGGGPDVR